MTLTEIKTLNDYNDWANERLCAMLRAAFGEETDLRESQNATVRAIQETAVHLIGAQAIWRARITGHAPTKPALDAAEYPTPLTIRFAFGAERARFRAWLDTLENDADLEREIAYVMFDGTPCRQPLAQILQHLLTHAMYHRGQITARLIDAGHEKVLVSTDLIAYYRDFASDSSNPPTL